MRQFWLDRKRWIWATVAVVVMAALVVGGVTLAGAEPGSNAEQDSPTPTLAPALPTVTPAPPPYEKRPPTEAEELIMEFLGKLDGMTPEEAKAAEDELFRELERRGLGKRIITSGPETKGTTIYVVGKPIKLPEDAYIKHLIGRIDCYPGFSCPKPPGYVIARGDSEIWLSGPTGEIFYEQMAPGEEGTFDFLKEALK